MCTCHGSGVLLHHGQGVHHCMRAQLYIKQFLSKETHYMSKKTHYIYYEIRGDLQLYIKQFLCVCRCT